MYISSLYLYLCVAPVEEAFVLNRYLTSFSDGDFWFPLNSSASGPEPPCAQGHTATYDPDSKAVFVYGGLREGRRYTELYILNTLTWKWKLVNVGLLLTCCVFTFFKSMYVYVK